MTVVKTNSGLLAQVTRKQKVDEIKALAIERIGARVPALANPDTLDLIQELLVANMLAAPSDGTDMAAVRDIWVYAKTKIQQALSGPIAAVAAYDPAADAAFPS